MGGVWKIIGLICLVALLSRDHDYREETALKESLLLSSRSRAPRSRSPLSGQPSPGHWVNY